MCGELGRVGLGTFVPDSAPSTSPGPLTLVSWCVCGGGSGWLRLGVCTRSDSASFIGLGTRTLLVMVMLLIMFNLHAQWLLGVLDPNTCALHFCMWISEMHMLCSAQAGCRLSSALPPHKLAYELGSRLLTAVLAGRPASCTVWQHCCPLCWHGLLRGL